VHACAESDRAASVGPFRHAVVVVQQDAEIAWEVEARHPADLCCFRPNTCVSTQGIAVVVSRKAYSPQQRCSGC
jgi:hypothetical protein